jgi:hypothetical protein
MSSIEQELAAAKATIEDRGRAIALLKASKRPGETKTDGKLASDSLPHFNEPEEDTRYRFITIKIQPYNVHE